MTGELVEKYIREILGCEPKHDCEALANAIHSVAKEVDFSEERLMMLLLENKPIKELHTHSYGFHTSYGRSLIEGIKNKYYEYKK